MKLINRIGTVFLAILLSMCFISSEAVFATEDTKANIFVQSQSGNAGDNVDINISVKNNPGIAGATLQIEYDPKLTLQSVDNGEALSGLTFTKPAQFDNPSRFLWDSETGMSQKDGVILALHFLVSDKVTAGDKLPVHVSYMNGDIYNENLEDVNLRLEDGVITIDEGSDCGTKGHSPMEPVKENIKKATCTSEGSYESVVYCGKCKNEISRSKVVVKKVSHKVVVDKAVKSTYTKTGLTEGKHCSVCKQVLVKQKKIPKLEKKIATIKIAKKTANYTVSKLKKAGQSFNIGVKITGNGQFTCKKISGSSKLSVSKTGKISVKKGTKKGTYKISIQIKAAESSQYKAKTIKTMVTVKVK